MDVSMPTPNQLSVLWMERSGAPLLHDSTRREQLSAGSA
jgi:hypothetical protein